MVDVSIVCIHQITTSLQQLSLSTKTEGLFLSLVPNLRLGMPSCNAPRCKTQSVPECPNSVSTRSVNEGIPKRSLGTRKKTDSSFTFSALAKKVGVKVKEWLHPTKRVGFLQPNVSVPVQPIAKIHSVLKEQISLF